MILRIEGCKKYPNFPSRIRERGNCIFIVFIFSMYLACYAKWCWANESEESDFVCLIVNSEYIYIFVERKAKIFDCGIKTP